MSIADCQLTKLRPSWPHHCYIWHQNPFAFNLDVMSNSLLICERPLPHFPIQGSLKVKKKWVFYLQIPQKLLLDAPLTPSLSYCTWSKIFSFTFPQKYPSWLYPFSEPLRPFEPLQNPQTQVTLKPSNPQTQVKTHNQKSHLEHSTPSRSRRPNRIQKSTQYIYFSPSVSVLCNPFTMDLSRHYVNRPPFIQDCIRLFCSSEISFLHL